MVHPQSRYRVVLADAVDLFHYRQKSTRELVDSEVADVIAELDEFRKAAELVKNPRFQKAYEGSCRDAGTMGAIHLMEQSYPDICRAVFALHRRAKPAADDDL